MKYIVMECHFSYAVLLDENGKFLKAANRNYQVGQTVTDPVLVGDYNYHHFPPLARIIGRIIGLLLLILAIFLCVRHCSLQEDAKTTTAPGVTTAVSGDSTLSQEDACAIALRHAKLSEGDVTFQGVELDSNDGRSVYELEFVAGGMEYEYEIDACTGEILKFQSEPID